MLPSTHAHRQSSACSRRDRNQRDRDASRRLRDLRRQRAEVTAERGRAVDELARAFRIDLSDVAIELDFHPDDDRLDGSAVLTFSMREGQTKPLFHFNPVRSRSTRKERKHLQTLRLNGEELDPQDNGDLRKVKGAKKAEPAFEIQREVGTGEHTLEVTWSLPKATRSIPKDGRRSRGGWLYPIFDDTEGPRRQTETMWPTVSSPEDLARHRVTLRVHDAAPHTVIGSGVVTSTGTDPQTWTIDTVEAISSSNVFFAAVPSADVTTSEFTVGEVDVTIVTDRSQGTLDHAEQVTRETITQLVEDFGEFPPPSMHILLTGWGSGMEYYGATRTGVGALEHELVHMYFATVTVNRTWRDTWFDEAAVQWWQGQDDIDGLPRRFRSKIALGRPAAAPGFDGRAYGPGARILAEIADALGGTTEMLAFLRDLHERRAFAPFTTEDFIEDVLAAQQEIDRAQLERWLYGGK